MLQKGYCSVFDRLREQRLHKRKVLQRKEELVDKRKKRKRFVAACLQRTASGQALQSQRQVPLETLYRSKSNLSHQMETTRSRRKEGTKGKQPGNQRTKMLRQSRSKQVVKEAGFGEFALLASASKKSLASKLVKLRSL